MSFRSQVLNLLRIVNGSGQNALIAQAGANTQGFGQANIAMYTNAVTETWPAEITAYNEGAPNNQDALVLTSPGILVPPQLNGGRSQIIMAAGNNTGVGVIGRDTIQILADSVEIQGDPTSPLANGILTITSDLTWQGTKHTLPLQDNATGRTNITAYTAPFAARGGGFPSWVTPIGSDLALIQVQCAPTSAVTSQAVFTLPAGFRPASTQDIQLAGAVTASSGTPIAEIAASTGVCSIFFDSIAANAIVHIFGVYSIT